MELCAAVCGCFLGWVLLAVYPRHVVKLSWKILQALLILMLCSFLLPWLCSELLACGLIVVLAVVLYSDLPSPRMTANGKAVLITGCDCGIGHATALHLDKLGFQVFASCLQMGGPGETALVRAASDRLTTLQMDVSNEQQVNEAAAFVASRLQGKVLHGVLNNAGIMLVGNVEIMSLQDIRKIIDVNCMGLIHVYRAFMPLLRQPRRGTARLVNIASNMGLYPAAQVAIYGASKGAVALLSETWRYELKPFGIDVSTIIPSAFKTGIQVYDKETVANRWWEAANQEVRNYFGRACFVPVNKTKNYTDYLSSDLSKIIDCVTDALLATHPKPIYYKGFLARSMPFLFLHLPSCFWDLIMPYLADYYHFPVQALRVENGSHHMEHSKMS